MSRLAVLSSVCSALLVCGLVPASAAAQDPAGDPPAHISYVDGAAVLERDGRHETAPASMPLLAGDRVRTQDGRVEILFADGSTLHLDANTVVDFQSDEVIRLLSGRVRISIAGSTRSVAYRVDAPSAWVQIATPGEYRIGVAAGDEVELAVLRGAAELVNEDGRTVLSAGERAFARVGASPSSPYVFNSAAWDSFDRWSEGRREARLGVSAQYLPDTVQPYAATFTQYGSWQNVPTYGHVWYPRVRPGWRPYYYGRWTTLRPWGWTWIGSDPWAWPTHHYGRWGFSAGAWFWIPGRTWGPAWVSWAYAPGYVSWCPLGWNNRPVLQFVNVNFYGGRRYDPWHAWTVVPHRGFGRGHVNVHVVNASRIDFRTRSAFVVRDTAPDTRGYAVPRSSSPIRTAVSRNGAFGGSAAFQRGNDAFQRSRTGGSIAGPQSPQPQQSLQGDSGATAAFRSRRGASESGAQVRGYPAPARAPQAVPSRERGVPSTASPERQGRARSRESGALAAPSRPQGAERRAVPRTVPDSGVPVTSPEISSSPSRRSAPERGLPAPEVSSPAYGERSDRYNRAVPRAERPESNVYAPSPSYGSRRERGGEQQRNPYRAPDAPEYAPRAVPRSAPEGGVAPDRGSAPERRDAPSYRPGGVQGSPPIHKRGGMERPAPAPSGPPPQSAAPPRGPDRSSEPSSGGGVRSRGDGERSRGDGQSTGRSAPRGRGGR
jgi:hypothetical protein